MAEQTLWHMAKCLKCERPESPWMFRSYAERSAWVGKHRVSTGHPVKQWLEVL